MPPISFHLSIALEAAPRIGGVVTEHLASYLFGSTLPDIHLLTTLSREETHHFGLSQSPLEEREPFLQFQRTFTARGKKEQALAAGYLSHLATDIIWIRDIYRPFFTPDTLLGAGPMADLYDRTLQFQIDVQERQQKKLLEVGQTLSDFEPVSWLAVDKESLNKWHGFILETVKQERSWETFPNYVRDFLLPHGKVRKEMVDEFLNSLPQRVKQLSEHIPQAKIEALKQKSVVLSVEIAKEYLDENLG